MGLPEQEHEVQQVHPPMKDEPPVEAVEEKKARKPRKKETRPRKKRRSGRDPDKVEVVPCIDCSAKFEKWKAHSIKRCPRCREEHRQLVEERKEQLRREWRRGQAHA